MRRYFLSVLTLFFLVTSIVSLSAGTVEPSLAIQKEMAEFQAYREKVNKVRQTFNDLYSSNETREDQRLVDGLIDAFNVEGEIFFELMLQVQSITKAGIVKQNYSADFYGAEFTLGYIKTLCKRYANTKNPLAQRLMHRGLAMVANDLGQALNAKNGNKDQNSAVLKKAVEQAQSNLEEICGCLEFQEEPFAHLPQAKKALLYLAEAALLFRNKAQTGENAEACHIVLRSMGKFALALVERAREFTTDITSETELLKILEPELFEAIEKVQEPLNALVVNGKGVKELNSDAECVTYCRKFYNSASKEIKKIITSLK